MFIHTMVDDPCFFSVHRTLKKKINCRTTLKGKKQTKHCSDHHMSSLSIQFALLWSANVPFADFKLSIHLSVNQLGISWDLVFEF